MTTEAKTGFTPGPWEVDEAGAHYTEILTQGKSLATVWYDYDADAPVNVANAALIAAAPEMYTALETVSDFIAVTVGFNILGKEAKAALETVFETIEPAMKKARGEQS